MRVCVCVYGCSFDICKCMSVEAHACPRVWVHVCMCACVGLLVYVFVSVCMCGGGNTWCVWECAVAFFCEFLCR